MNTVDINIETKEIRVKAKTLKVKWSVDTAELWGSEHNQDLIAGLVEAQVKLEHKRLLGKRRIQHLIRKYTK